MKAEQLAYALTRFTGTENYYRHLGSLLTDGAKYFAEKAGAYWLMDILATQPEIISEPLSVIELIVNADGAGSAVIVATDGNDREVYRREIDFTTCPAGTWRFFRVENVILLTSEY